MPGIEDEDLLLQDGPITVTSARARLGEFEIAIRDIRRVAVKREFTVLDAVLAAGVLALAGAVALYVYVNVWFAAGMAAAGAIMIATALFMGASRMFKLMVTTKDGKTHAFKSPQRIHIEKTVRAIKEALAARR